MRAIYYLWLFLNAFLCKFSEKLENFFFFYNNDRLYRFSNLNVFQRLFLIFFYNPKYYTRLRLSYKDNSKLGLDRLKNYRNIHNFMTYAFSKEQSTKKHLNKNKKTKYSLIKLIYRNVPVSFFSKQSDFSVLIIFLSKLNLAIKNYKLNFFWETLVPKSSSVINAVIMRKLVAHSFSNASYYRYNVATLSGFNNFIANLNNFNKKFSNSELDQRQKKILSLNYDQNSFIDKIIEKKHKKYTLVLNQYKKFYKSVSTGMNFNMISNNNLYSYFSNVSTANIVFKKKFFDFYKSFLAVNHLPTDVSKYFTYKTNITALFIRKNKIFNKGRYSRNRQLYRTGVYWCLILNILGVFGLYYYFYRFVFNFGYFWLPLCILILSIFGSRLVKYRFYNVFNIFNEIKLFINLIDSFIHSIVVNTFIRIKNFTIKMYYLGRFKLRFILINTKHSIIRMWKNF